jgi:undecaprenyl-diphosphatase
VSGLSGALAPLDQAVAGWLASAATPALIDAMRVVSTAHTPRGIAVLVAGAIVLLLALRDRAGALWVLLSFYSGAALNHLLKHLIQRPRPGQEGLAGPTDFAFPSGHAAQATLLYGALLLLLLRHTRSSPLRWAGGAGALVLVALVSASRLVLGAHRLSDVVAGILVAAAWLALCVALCAAWRRWSAQRPDQQ